MTNRNVVCISFRKNEMWLFDKLKTFSCPSGTVKDILKEYFKNEDRNNIQNSDTNKNNTSNNCGLNLMDF